MLLTGEGGGGGEGPGGSEWGCDDGAIVVVLIMMHCLLLLELHGAHSADGLFTLDALFLTRLEDFLVFYTEFTALYIEAVEGSDDGICVY